MKDILGVDVKKGDLILNYGASSSGGAYYRLGMVVGWTASNFIVGPKKPTEVGWGSNKKTRMTQKLFSADKSIVINHYWGKILSEIKRNPPQNKWDQHYDLVESLTTGIKPNIGNVRFPDNIVETKENIQPKEDLSEI